MKLGENMVTCSIVTGVFKNIAIKSSWSISAGRRKAGKSVQSKHGKIVCCKQTCQKTTYVRMLGGLSAQST